MFNVLAAYERSLDPPVSFFDIETANPTQPKGVVVKGVFKRNNETSVK